MHLDLKLPFCYKQSLYIPNQKHSMTLNASNQWYQWLCSELYSSRCWNHCAQSIRHRWFGTFHSEWIRWIQLNQLRKCFILSYAVVNVVFRLGFSPKRIPLPSKIVTLAVAVTMSSKWFVQHNFWPHFHIIVLSTPKILFCKRFS